MTLGAVELTITVGDFDRGEQEIGVTCQVKPMRADSSHRFVLRLVEPASDPEHLARHVAWGTSVGRHHVIFKPCPL